MVNKKNILQQCVTTQPGRNQLRTSKYTKAEAVLLEWFRQQPIYYNNNSRSNVVTEG
jgi:hypothetical protein